MRAFLQSSDVHGMAHCCLKPQSSQPPKIPGHGGDKNDNKTITKTITYRLAHADLKGVTHSLLTARAFRSVPRREVLCRTSYPREAVSA